MAVKMEEILASLDEANLRYTLHDVTGEPVILFPTDNFVNGSGMHVLVVVIQLTEDGEYIKFFVPSAYHLPQDETAYAALKSFAIIGWQVKLLDFEVDPDDGEVRPTIDFPIEDAKLTTTQIKRCCKTLARLVDIFHPHIKHALVHNQVHEALLAGDVKPLFEAYNEQESQEDRLNRLRTHLSTLKAQEETPNTDEKETSGEDTSESQETSEEDSSSEEWI